MLVDRATVAFVTTSTALRREFKASLNECLIAKAMTRGDLARKLAALGTPVTEQAIGCWLRGETTPSLIHQAAIARVFEIPVRSLFPVAWQS